jgi:hypothetical protein
MVLKHTDMQKVKFLWIYRTIDNRNSFSDFAAAVSALDPDSGDVTDQSNENDRS